MLNNSLGNIASNNVKEIINSTTELNPETIEELDLIAQLISDLKSTQAALQESEEKYRSLFSNVPLGILHFDSDGKITTCNDNFTSIIDAAREKVVGEYLNDVIDIHLASAIENALTRKVGHYEGDHVSRFTGRITPVRVNFAPIILDDGKMSGVVGIFEDITERKQIERIFFHDIINTAGSLNYITQLIDYDSIPNPETKELLEVVENISKRIIDEIRTHQYLVTSDKSVLNLKVKEIHSLNFLEGIRLNLSHFDNLGSIQIQISPESQDVAFETDETTLGRVLHNMIKNAIEASRDRDVVQLKCVLENNKVVFTVHNMAFIPEEIQTQLFNHSISTKGAGRGLGLFSMKYLSEKYLEGIVSFTSSKAMGTTFTVCYPLKLIKTS